MAGRSGWGKAYGSGSDGLLTAGVVDWAEYTMLARSKLPDVEIEIC